MPIYALPEDSCMFPPIELAEPDGLLAVGGDLSVPRLFNAYRHGIFPWYSQGDPILWWSPRPRCVILPENFHVPRSVNKVLTSGQFSFTVNAAFDKVIRHCASIYRPGQPGTWIVPEMIAAYKCFNRAGGAHSVEAIQDGKLVGGLYGIAIGRAFFGESMFHLRANASKAAFAWLARNLFTRGFRFIDCQQDTEHMRRFGSTLLPLEKFKTLLGGAISKADTSKIFQIYDDKAGNIHR